MREHLSTTSLQWALTFQWNNERTSLYNIIIVSINFNNERTSLYNIIVAYFNFPMK